MLDENWRPDRSGVVITTEPEATGSVSSLAISLLAHGDHAVVFDDGFAIYVATSIDRGHEALLKVARGQSHLFPEARLGAFVGEAVAAGNLAGVKIGIRDAYNALIAMPIPQGEAD